MEFYEHLFADSTRQHVTRTWLTGIRCRHGHVHSSPLHAEACPGRFPGDWIYRKAEDGGHEAQPNPAEHPLPRGSELPKRDPRPRLSRIFYLLAGVTVLIVVVVVVIDRWWQP